MKRGILGNAVWLATLTLTIAPAASVAAHATRHGRTAIKDTAHMRLVHAFGNNLTEEGSTGGTIPGKVNAQLDINSKTITVSWTLHPRTGGTISGHGVAAVHLGHGSYVSFAGNLTITKATGRYQHAHGTARVSGTIRRPQDSAVLEVAGKVNL